jgi:hypothetical protein
MIHFVRAEHLDIKFEFVMQPTTESVIPTVIHTVILPLKSLDEEIRLLQAKRLRGITAYSINEQVIGLLMR